MVGPVLLILAMCGMVLLGIANMVTVTYAGVQCIDCDAMKYISFIMGCVMGSAFLMTLFTKRKQPAIQLCCFVSALAFAIINPYFFQFGLMFYIPAFALSGFVLANMVLTTRGWGPDFAAGALALSFGMASATAGVILEYGDTAEKMGAGTELSIQLLLFAFATFMLGAYRLFPPTWRERRSYFYRPITFGMRE